jgi:hypothetical protein
VWRCWRVACRRRAAPATRGHGVRGLQRVRRRKAVGAIITDCVRAGRPFVFIASNRRTARDFGWPRWRWGVTAKTSSGAPGTPRVMVTFYVAGTVAPYFVRDARGAPAPALPQNASYSAAICSPKMEVGGSGTRGDGGRASPGDGGEGTGMREVATGSRGGCDTRMRHTGAWRRVDPAALTVYLI